MSSFVIGDVHGNRVALDDLLGRIRRDVSAGDTVVFLGDYIDRGPDSKGCIESILRFQAESPAAVVALAGNHEDWLLQTLDDHTRHSWLLGMEALETIASYSLEAAAEIRAAAEEAGIQLVTGKVTLPYGNFIKSIPNPHLEFLRGLRTFLRTDNAFCVHGGLDLEANSPDKQSREALIWGSESFLRDYTGPELIVYGHWDNAEVDTYGWPRPAFGRASIGIDTISHGVLTALRLPEGVVLQSARHKSNRGRA